MLFKVLIKKYQWKQKKYIRKQALGDNHILIGFTSIYSDKFIQKSEKNKFSKKIKSRLSSEKR